MEDWEAMEDLMPTARGGQQVPMLQGFWEQKHVAGETHMVALSSSQSSNISGPLTSPQFAMPGSTGLDSDINFLI